MKTPLRHVPSLAGSLLAVALGFGCGPADSNSGDDDSAQCVPGTQEVCNDGRDNDCDDKIDCDDTECTTNPACTGCTPTAEVCDDHQDNDCDNIVDCDDADCEGHPACPATTCGTLQAPEGMLALPDGACPEDETQPCAGFEDTLQFTGFTTGQTLDDISKLLGICVNMEHSWMRDIVIYAECPNGTRVMLEDFMGHTGGEVFLGIPNGQDGGPPGTGWDYCWTPAATDAPWIPYANAHPQEHTLHSGDYQSSQPLNAFVGCPLNGGWKIRVEDRWGADDGYIFKWSVRFDPSIVQDCENWPQ